MSKFSTEKKKIYRELQNLLIRIVQCYVQGNALSADINSSLYEMDDERWCYFTQVVYMHRVFGVLCDAIDVEKLAWERRARLAGELLLIENSYSKRAELQEKVLGLLRGNGISCIPLKGVSLAGQFAGEYRLGEDDVQGCGGCCRHTN